MHELGSRRKKDVENVVNIKLKCPLMDSDEMQMSYLATVKPSGSPHVVPMLVLNHSGKIYFETDRKSVKIRNIMKNNKVAAVTPGGGYGNIVIEGKARIITDEEVEKHIVAKLLETKHPWKPRFGKSSTIVLVEITPNKTMKI